ncbi:hypothetical protein GUJ93_ZPchr0008g11882 [Zizania palustris]|uniref:Uncharacterized protein n=1 Tax=Zizania palustris TaxID=103762 RepID=A0A8J5QYH2_ZIZPA|nr:hypothetical protein GUJ93_ZPchr0008g11882 [Zizania palustris]
MLCSKILSNETYLVRLVEEEVLKTWKPSYVQTRAVPKANMEKMRDPTEVRKTKKAEATMRPRGSPYR